MAKYNQIQDVFDDCTRAMEEGKGEQRHGTEGVPLEDQHAFLIMKAQQSPSFATGQAMKKILESQRLELGAERHELIGAINYLALAVAYLDWVSAGRSAA